MAEEDNEAPAQEPAKGGKGRLLIIGGVAVVLVAAGTFAALAVMNRDEPPAGEPAATVAAATPEPALYASLHPPLVVNLTDAGGAQHFMQVTLEVMARDQGVINTIRDNTAVIRNSLILLYGGAVYEDVVTRQGKEKMLADGLAEIRRVMKAQAGTSGIEALYFTNLIIQ